MPFITDPLFYLLAIPAVLITGISKGGFAGGAGNMLMPLMALAVPAPVAAGIALPLLCAMDVSGLKAWWGKWDKREMRVLIPGALVGILVGGLAFSLFSDRAIKAMVGLTTLVFLARTLWLARHRAAPPAAPHDPVKGTICAAASGFTSTIAHAGSPPLAIYMYPRRLDRQVMAATSVVFFGIVNYVKLIPYFLLGNLSAANLSTSLVLLPLAPVGVYLGIWLQKHVPDALFYKLLYGLLLVTGLKLTWDGVFRMTTTRVLGVLGGMGPLAGATFMQRMTLLTPADRDQDHIPSILWSDPRVPDRTAARLSGGEDPLPWLLRGIRGLEAAGCGAIAIPCNTAHGWFDGMQNATRLPILHIVEAAADELLRLGITAGPIGLMATKGTLAMRLYQDRLEGRGYDCLVPPEADMDRIVMPAIDLVKANRVAESYAALAETARRLIARGARAVVLGCTEIPLGIGAGPALPFPVADTIDALARAAIAWAKPAG